MPEVAWNLIEPLTEAELQTNTDEFDSLYEVWIDARISLEQEHKEAFDLFWVRLKRAWSIETGILENLYNLSRGTTQTLIDQGFRSDLLGRAPSDGDPDHIVEVLRDHLRAADLIQGLIEDPRPLTLHFIRELHAALTQHQEFIEGVDSLGHPIRSEVLRGQWRNSASKRQNSTGDVFYCPPEQIEGQMQDLVDFLGLQEEEGINVCLLAAWFHHRLTYIHPFQDGNGRVARALVNYLFIKQHLFPVIVDRDQKPKYIEALEAADNGDIVGVADMFALKEGEAIKKALSLAGADPSEPKSNLVADLAGTVLDRRQKRQETALAQLRQLNDVLKNLAEVAEQRLIEENQEFKRSLQEGGLTIDVDVDAGGPEDSKQHYYRWEVIESAKKVEQWANFNEESRWVRGLVVGEGNRLRFIVSFHHVGHIFTGVGEITAFADLEGTDDPKEPASNWPNRRPVTCMLQPFSVTVRTTGKEKEFVDWLQECLAMALRGWAETV